MTSTPRSSLLSKPLYVFSLPPTLLEILTSQVSIQPAIIEADPSEAGETGTVQSIAGFDAGDSSLSCSVCQTSFTTLDEQRKHFKSDWHRYNVKVGLKTGSNAVGGGKRKGPLTLDEFEELRDGVSSLSGSESDSSSPSTTSDQPSTNKLTRLLAKTTTSTSSPLNPNSLTQRGGVDDDDDSLEAAEEADHRRRAALRTALLWFKPSSALLSQQAEPIVSQDTQFGVYRAVLPPGLQSSEDFLPALRAIQLPPPPPPPTSKSDEEVEDLGRERKLTLLMVAGGHFAGMVISLRPLRLTQIGNGKGSIKPEKQDVKGAGDIRVLQHKTFHRYTTRKKQGGSQSLHDDGKGKANSAGAMLRRYGEQTLKEEIQALMIEWEDEIRSSEKIFLRASTAGKRSFWGYDGAVLEKGDERIRVFPFPTRRPTLSELLRCFNQLTKVKISHLSEEALKALEDAYIASLQPKSKPVTSSTPQVTATPKVVVPKLSAEEESYRDRRRRLVEMIKKGRMEPLLPLWEKYNQAFGGVEARLEDWLGADEGRGLTVLMLASQAGQEDVVKWLLEDIGANPTVAIGSGASVAETQQEEQPEDGEEEKDAETVVRPKPGGSRTAYDLAPNKSTRNVFRRCAFNKPDQWDWTGAGHVPSGLSEEKEQEQEKKKLDRRKGLREKAKEREAAKKASEPAEAVKEVAASKPVAAPAPKEGPQKLGGGRPGGENGLMGLTPEMRARIERERRARAAEARLQG